MSNRQARLPQRINNSRHPTRRLFLEPLEDRRLLAFDVAVNYAAGTNPLAMVTADFNNDTVLDLVVANVYNLSSSDVSILLGNPDGTFQSAFTAPAGGNPLSLAVGDFDEDGNLDLAATSHYDVQVMRGDGQGSFDAPTSVGGVVGNPKSVAVGDFNGDGLLDLGVTSNVYLPGSYGYCGYRYYYCSTPGYYNGYANVLLGNGSGGFAAPKVTSLGTGFHTSAAVANFNGDISTTGQAIDDFATINSEYGYVSVLLGQNSGYLQARSFLSAGDNPISVTAGDVNADTHMDLVTANFSGNAVGVLLGDGSGGFGGPTSYAAGGYPYSIVLADFTHDGNLDVATANFYSNQVAVLHGSSTGGFSTPALSAVGSFPAVMVAGDFNQDGWLDAASANPGTPNVSVLINDQSWPAPPPSVRIDDLAVTEGHAGTVTASFAVTLSNNPSQPLTIHYTTADGSATAASGDYQSQSGTLTFQPGGPLTQSIPVVVSGDRRGELTETFVVNITSPTALVADAQATATIIDDEPTVTIGDASVTEGNSGTISLSFVVSLSVIYDAAVTVSYATQNGSATAGSDYAAAAGTLTFAPGDTSETIAVVVNGDRLVELDETFLVRLSNSVNARLADDQGSGVIQNDDATKFYVVDASAEKTFEYGASGESVENYYLGWGNDDPRGAASYAGGDRVWVIDSDEYVDVYDAAGNHLGFWKAKGLDKPEGIASNGTDIWIVDRGSDRVYRYAGAANRTSSSMSPTSSFSLNSGNRDAKGIETDGKHLWVINDASSNKVFKYTLSGALVGSWTINGSNTSPTGITLDPSNPSDIWIVDSGRDQVFQYTAAAGRTSGSQSPSAVFNLAPGNTNPQGIADPPPPALDALPGPAAALSAAAIDNGDAALPQAESRPTPSRDKPLPPAGSSPRANSPDRRWQAVANKSVVPEARLRTAADGSLDGVLADAALAGYLAESPPDRVGWLHT
jgi:hypothetical protein